MPIYVYRCQQCNEYTEALQKASDPLLQTCPHCQAQALVKVIAPVGVIFKGTGFHKNDYSGKSGGSAGASKPAETGDSKQAETKSEGAAASSTSSSSDTGTSSGGGDTGPKPSGGDKVA